MIDTKKIQELFEELEHEKQCSEASSYSGAASSRPSTMTGSCSSIPTSQISGRKRYRESDDVELDYVEISVRASRGANGGISILRRAKDVVSSSHLASSRRSAAPAIQQQIIHESNNNAFTPSQRVQETLAANVRAKRQRLVARQQPKESYYQAPMLRSQQVSINGNYNQVTLVQGTGSSNETGKHIRNGILGASLIGTVGGASAYLYNEKCKREFQAKLTGQVNILAQSTRGLEKSQQKVSSSAGSSSVSRSRPR